MCPWRKLWCRGPGRGTPAPGVESRGYPPSMREIGEAVGLSSTPSVR
ncbi:hypothetical protein AB0C36_16475, partial [Streptodolium elevatio]